MMTNTIPRMTEDVSDDLASDSAQFAVLLALLTAQERKQVMRELDSLLAAHIA